MKAWLFEFSIIFVAVFLAETLVLYLQRLGIEPAEAVVPTRGGM